MFSIADGRKALWQWDLNQKLDIAGSCTEVHFLDRGSLTTLTVEVKDGKADIPNALLQKAGKLVVYAYIIDEQDRHTKVCEAFAIAARPKPAGYVYTETEIKTWHDLQAEIGDLSDLTTEAKDDLVSAINEAAQSGGSGGASDAVLYTEQSLTEEQQAQARENIGATDLSLGLTSASVGQIIKVKAVDEDGKPTEWETAEMAGGDGEAWEVIAEGTVLETANLLINEDSDGSSFSLKSAVLLLKGPIVAANNTYMRVTVGNVFAEGTAPMLRTTNAEDAPCRICAVAIHGSVGMMYSLADAVSWQSSIKSSWRMSGYKSTEATETETVITQPITSVRVGTWNGNGQPAAGMIYKLLGVRA